ncbi:SDR family oxidoreductase [Rossellomorea aquimaris]|uniref:SDR family NAD(P)-dependent oxidoreductase n=1 Tax=Rossellomorea aquimaris TaxID=189382 RepID=UPI001CD31024|nr:SDR family oxidoreductase [Rossellomorea aquimaris]MCA1055877.1 SDR family oxidoreductase [Rossellomorea aquimaris]
MNKTIVIIGAGKGISYQAAKRYGQKGFNVALISRTSQSLKELEKELAEFGVNVKGFQGDVSSQASLQQALSSVRAEFGDTIDVLLYNAASIRPGNPSTIRREDFLYDFQVNAAGALAAVQEALPFLHDEGASILLTGGGLALNPYAEYASLSVGKAALRSLALSLHQELSPRGIYVGTLTINGFVQEDTHFSAEKISEALYRMHIDRKHAEIVYEQA